MPPPFSIQVVVSLKKKTKRGSSNVGGWVLGFVTWSIPGHRAVASGGACPTHPTAGRQFARLVGRRLRSGGWERISGATEKTGKKKKKPAILGVSHFDSPSLIGVWMPLPGQVKGNQKQKATILEVRQFLTYIPTCESLSPMPSLSASATDTDGRCIGGCENLCL